MSGVDDAEVLSRFEGALDLVDVVAAKLARVMGTLVEYDDLVSAGREGLLSAARRFDAERGVPFRAFASYRIRGAILDGVRRAGPIPRKTYERLLAMARASTTSDGRVDDAFSTTAPNTGAETDADGEGLLVAHLADVATAAGLAAMIAQVHEEIAANAQVDADPEQALVHAELMALLRDGIGGLQPDESEIIRRHYLEEQTLEEIAAAINISSSWASRLHTRAVSALTKRVRAAV